jgi:hypothetical protein
MVVKQHTISKAMIESLLMAYLFLSMQAGPLPWEPGKLNGYRLDGDEPPELRLGAPELLDRLPPPL